MNVKEYFDTYKLFDITISILFRVILFFLIIVLCAATVKLFLGLGVLIQAKTITGSYKDLISDVFTLYILIEIARSLADYFHTHKLRLSFIVDAVIVFILRDIMMLLYMKEIDIKLLYGLAVMLVVLGVLRTSCIIVFKHEKLMSKEIT